MHSWAGTDLVKRTEFNDNFNILDQEIPKKYVKPTTGIPKSDLESGVQASLGKADTALQSVPNGSTSKAGIVQLTDSVSSTSIATAATPNSVKQVNDVLVAHKADNTSHITASERTAWNQKQDALPAENRRKITFGTEEPSGGSDGDIYLQYV